MKTYYIANNKTAQYCIYQTNKSREDIWSELDNSVDIVKEVENINEAYRIAETRTQKMELVPYDTFIK